MSTRRCGRVGAPVEAVEDEQDRPVQQPREDVRVVPAHRRQPACARASCRTVHGARCTFLHVAIVHGSVWHVARAALLCAAPRVQRCHADVACCTRHPVCLLHLASGLLHLAPGLLHLASGLLHLSSGRLRETCWLLRRAAPHVAAAACCRLHAVRAGLRCLRRSSAGAPDRSAPCTTHVVISVIEYLCCARASACVRQCVRASVCASVRVPLIVRACVRACTCVSASASVCASVRAWACKCPCCLHARTCVRVPLRVLVYVLVYVRACGRACVRARASVRACA